MSASKGPIRYPFRLDEQIFTKLNYILRLGAIQTGLYLLPSLAIFAIGYDQGHILEALLGIEAGINRLHEFFHDIRHAAGFMCH